jgi:sugar lactone lactonase YvrE
MKNLACTLLLALAAGTSAPDAKIEFEARELYPEGVAFCPKQNVYFVSSARFGTIGKVTPDGKYTAFYEDASLKPSYGLKLSSDGKIVYACVSDANYSKAKSPDTYRKMARLISLDATSGRKIMDVDLSKLTSGKHFINDLAFDNKGNAYLTDSFSNAIYKVDKNGQASLFSKSDLFKTEGVGLNGIAYNKDGFLLVDSSGKGELFKVDIANPSNVKKVRLDQFFLGADGLLLTDKNTLALVQNGGVNKIYELQSSDNWQSAKVKSNTGDQRFSYPSTATSNAKDVWVMNAKFNELADSTTVPSLKFMIQKANFIVLPKK